MGPGERGRRENSQEASQAGDRRHQTIALESSSWRFWIILMCSGLLTATLAFVL